MLEYLTLRRGEAWFGPLGVGSYEETQLTLECLKLAEKKQRNWVRFLPEGAQTLKLVPSSKNCYYRKKF